MTAVLRFGCLPLTVHVRTPEAYGSTSCASSGQRGHVELLHTVFCTKVTAFRLPEGGFLRRQVVPRSAMVYLRPRGSLLDVLVHVRREGSLAVRLPRPVRLRLGLGINGVCCVFLWWWLVMLACSNECTELPLWREPVGSLAAAWCPYHMFWSLCREKRWSSFAPCGAPALVLPVGGGISSGAPAGAVEGGLGER